MQIKVFSTPTCPYCKLVKEYFKEKGLTFDDIDVAADGDAAEEMVKISGQMGVPVIEIDGQIIVGWNKGALDELINKRAEKVAG